MVSPPTIGPFPPPRHHRIIGRSPFFFPLSIRRSRPLPYGLMAVRRLGLPPLLLFFFFGLDPFYSTFHGGFFVHPPIFPPFQDLFTTPESSLFHCHANSSLVNRRRSVSPTLQLYFFPFSSVSPQDISFFPSKSCVYSLCLGISSRKFLLSISRQPSPPLVEEHTEPAPPFLRLRAGPPGFLLRFPNPSPSYSPKIFFFSPHPQ